MLFLISIHSVLAIKPCRSLFHPLWLGFPFHRPSRSISKQLDPFDQHINSGRVFAITFIDDMKLRAWQIGAVWFVLTRRR